MTLHTFNNSCLRITKFNIKNIYIYISCITVSRCWFYFHYVNNVVLGKVIRRLCQGEGVAKFKTSSTKQFQVEMGTAVWLLVCLLSNFIILFPFVLH